jgi:tetratricopeptide (TPR) repeat protein
MDPNALYNQATAAIKANQPEQARRLLVEVVRANPRHEQAWLALASVLTDMDQAIDCLKRVLALNPDNATAKEWLAFAEQERARQEAVAEMQAPPPATPDDVPIDEPGDEERPVPRLGKYLLDYKFITPEQLKAALRAQRKAVEAGQNKRLGDILMEQGAITEERLSFAIREQHRGFYSLFND